MPDAKRTWPQKTREIQNCICDSTRWNGFKFRDDDIVVATYAKTGTTWTQQIIGQLIFRGAEGPLFDNSPWVDFRPFPLDQITERLEAQTHRRFVKTHLPLDALVFAPQAKYIYISRDGRDTLWSLYNHHAGFTDQAYELINNVPRACRPSLAHVLPADRTTPGEPLPHGAVDGEHVARQRGWREGGLPFAEAPPLCTAGSGKHDQ
jgi:aryl sulfotransferase